MLWQDGTITSGLASNRLYAPVVVDDSMMLPTEYVIHKSTDVGENADRDEKVGVIQKIDHVERTALVRWFNDGEDLDGLQVRCCQKCYLLCSLAYCDLSYYIMG